MLLLLFCFVGLVASDFHEQCRESLAIGRENVRKVANDLVEEEIAMLFTQFNAAFEEMGNHVADVVKKDVTSQDDGDGEGMTTTYGPSLCPKPNETMFPTSPPPPTGATVPLNPATASPAPGQDGGSTAGPAAGSTSPAAQNGASSTANPGAGASSSAPGSGSTVQAADEDEPFKAKSMYLMEGDPVAGHFEWVHSYLSEPDKVCDNKFTDLNSLTEHQLYGFFATLATAHPGPFCSLCHRMVEEVSSRAFAISMVMEPDEAIMAKMLYSYLPSSKAICSALAPGCYENFEEKVNNFTDSVVCAECSACMSITNVIQHRVLLQKDAVASFLRFLQSSLFHNICAELCPILSSPANVNFTSPLFPKGFTYNKCQNWFTKQFDGVVNFLTVFTRPERLCSLELGWCELNEVPNMLHCLRELCVDFLSDVAQAQALCALIPDRPEDADAFLNIQRTKRYKQKKAYHRVDDAYEILKDEL